MRQINFIAGQDGSVVKYDPSVHRANAPVPKELTRHQRATLYFTAVRYVDKLFREVGFTPVTASSANSFTIELGDFMLEMTVAQPPPMAHVTSYPGYVYDSEKITAKVTNISPGSPGEYVIRVIGTLPGLRTCAPIYAVIEKDSVDPLRDAFMNALTAARSLIEKDPATLDKIKRAMANRNIAEDFEKFRSSETNQLSQ